MRLILVTLLILLPSIARLSAQQKDLVTHQGITSPLHKANIGKITFASREIPIADYKESDFLTSYELTHKSPLYMTVFMGNSLTNYMHPLAPELSADELAKKGNYYFSFYVDGRLVYQDALNPGAPYAELKHKETIISKPLIAHPFRDWWSAYLWNRFMSNGGEKALSEGKHLFKLEIRPYVKNPELKTGGLIAAGQVELHVKKPKIDLAALQTVQLREAKPYSGLQVSKEEFDRSKIKELKASIEADIFKDITGLVVLKNGEILIEEYFNNANRNTLHDVRSVGKSFASTMTGIAIHEGYLKNENQILKEFYDIKKFANYSPQKENTTLKELLTMSSVFEGNDDNSSSAGNEENMYPTKDWVKFTLDLPIDLVRPAGEWHYFTAGVVLLGDVLHQSVPGGLEKYADEKLFKPLGITQYKWPYTPQKVASTAGGIQMNALDFARYGQLYKNEGQWNGKQVLPKEWVNKTFTKHKPIPGRKKEYYGYLFWNKKYQVNGKEYETFYCAGNGGNKIFIFKDQPLVVVVTATAYNRPYGHSQVDKIMESFVLPAIINANTHKSSVTKPVKNTPESGSDK